MQSDKMSARCQDFCTNAFRTYGDDNIFPFCSGRAIWPLGPVTRAAHVTQRGNRRELTFFEHGDQERNMAPVQLFLFSRILRNLSLRLRLSIDFVSVLFAERVQKSG